MACRTAVSIALTGRRSCCINAPVGAWRPGWVAVIIAAQRALGLTTAATQIFRHPQ